MTPVQCKMARVALGIGVRDLASAAAVSPNTIARLERGEALKASTLKQVAAALEAAGVILIAENGDGPGVRLRKAAAAPTGARGPATDAMRAMNAAIEHHEQAAKPAPRKRAPRARSSKGR